MDLYYKHNINMNTNSTFILYMDSIITYTLELLTTVLKDSENNNNNHKIH